MLLIIIFFVRLLRGIRVSPTLQKRAGPQSQTEVTGLPDIWRTHYEEVAAEKSQSLLFAFSAYFLFPSLINSSPDLCMDTYFSSNKQTATTERYSLEHKRCAFFVLVQGELVVGNNIS